MNFFQFLQKDNAKDELCENKTLIDITKNKVVDNNVKNDPNDLNDLSTLKNLKSGDFVKIIWQKGSPLNHYKGYYGEVKNYKKDQDHASIFLHAPSNLTILKFPLTHFIKRT
jgi:hypothetical protein